MKRFVVLSLLVLAAVSFSGCWNPDFRLNGTWNGKLYYKGAPEDGSYTFYFNRGMGTLTWSESGYRGSEPFNYTTKFKLSGPNDLTVTIFDEFTIGMYKFDGISKGNLYVALDLFDVAFTERSLEPAVGPVFVLTKVSSKNLLSNTWDYLASCF